MASPPLEPTWQGGRCHYHVHVMNDQPQQQPQPQPQRSKLLRPIDQFKFDIYVNVSCSVDANSPTMTITPLSDFSPLYVACRSFFRKEGQCFLRAYLSNPYVPSTCLDQLIERVIAEVQQSFEFDESFGYEDGKLMDLDLEPCVFPLILDVMVELLEEEQEEEEEQEQEQEEQEEVDEHGVIEESIQEIKMIPTCMEVIKSLTERSKLKLQKQCDICMEDFDDGDQFLPMTCGRKAHIQCLKKSGFTVVKQCDVCGQYFNLDFDGGVEKFCCTFAKQCIICMEDFDGGDEVMPMPCGHVFHSSCLVEWLHTSHTCPLCRFAMPTARN